MSQTNLLIQYKQYLKPKNLKAVTECSAHVDLWYKWYIKWYIFTSPPPAYYLANPNNSHPTFSGFFCLEIRHMTQIKWVANAISC